MRARTVQVWLLFGARLLCQSNRLSLGGLMPLLADELRLSVPSRGELLAAFPLGYMLTQVLGGSASDRLGGKPIMGVALVSIGIGIAVLGRLQSFGAMWWTLFFMGVLEGPSFPTGGVILGRWVPAAERARATAVSDAGGPVGALVALFVTPLLAASWGWRSACMVNGCFTLAFALLWAVVAASSPASCSYIAAGELQELRAGGVAVDGEAGAKRRVPPGGAMPWIILTLPSVWGVFVGHVAFNYNRYLMYNWIVTYYTDALHVPVSEAGLYMFWPNAFDALFSFVVGHLADAAVASGRVSMVATRRIFAALGYLGTGIGAALLPFAEGPITATVLVTLASSMQACHNAGFKSSYGDLSVEYGGFLRGIGNTLGTGSSFVVPMLAARLLESGGGSREHGAWQAVFQSVLICSLLGTAAYGALVSTECIDGIIAKRAAGQQATKEE